METRPAWFYRQSGVIPFRQVDGRLEILLITTRRNKRWIIPKGIVEPGLTAVESAAREAWEEAGIRGAIRPVSLGEYRYAKWGGTCTVEVFLCRVDDLAEQWPESAVRSRIWVSRGDAIERVREEGLKSLLAGLSEVPVHIGGEGDWSIVDGLREVEK